MSAPWGASRTDWARVKKLAKRDALPVVSDPHAPISLRSNMKGVGKISSIFNSQGHVIGFPKWTENETINPQLAEWQAEDAYGICIQTRDVRAFDIDVSDKVLAKKIRLRFLELVGLVECPRRWRADSGKELLAFRVEGTGEELTRRSFIVKEWEDETTGKTKRWLVEFLATGQQFIAAGTHPDGERYQWDGDGYIPDEVPTITLEAFLHAWAVLCEEFMLEGTEPRHRNVRAPTLTENIDVVDPVIEHLVESGYPTYGYERGMLYVECPWSDTHGNDNGPTQTAWMPAGTGKYRNGHFSCRHTGCDCHTDADFLKAVGYRPAKADEFEDLTEEGALEDAKAARRREERREVARKHKALPGPSAKANDRFPGFVRHEKTDKIVVTLTNLRRFVGSYAASGVYVAYDTFRGELMIAEAPGEWQSMTDADTARLRAVFETMEGVPPGTTISKELMRDALDWAGDENQFDSAIEWLTKVVPPWDGVARIHRFWPDYMQTKDTRYTRALGNYIWTALAGRVLDPGCQVDMVPVMVSPEGHVKTSVIAALAPSREFFTEFNLGDDDDKLARKMRGTLVGELAELRGISARDGEAVKSWITRREEKWTPKYKEYATTLPRRLVLFGTTNEVDFLQPHMGERRWLPVNVLAEIDLRKIRRDLMQLWAEARDVWQFEGQAWQEVQELAKGERSAFRYQDAFHDQIAKWIDESLDDDETLTPRSSGILTVNQVLEHCLGLDPARTRKSDQQRVGEVLTSLRMVRILKRIDGRPTRVWIDARSVTGIGSGTAKRLAKLNSGGGNGEK